MKAYDITKLTAKLESDNIQYINKIYYCCFVWWASIDRCRKHL